MTEPTNEGPVTRPKTVLYYVALSVLSVVNSSRSHNLMIKFELKENDPFCHTLTQMVTKIIVVIALFTSKEYA